MNRPQPNASHVASVATLVNQRLNEADRWNLATVQRDEVWDEVRMRHLLDSLLAGYPIGAILLSRVGAGGMELAYGQTGMREVRDAKPGAWQVLDGQQRINALFSVFTDQGLYGTFFVNMLMERPEPAPAQGRRAKLRTLQHIQHLDPEGEETDTDPMSVENRDAHLDLSRWASWANAQAHLVDLDLSPATIAALIREIDPGFRAELTEAEAEIASENLNRLIRAWTRESIPLLRVELNSPMDVLEVFSRINLGGVAVAGADVYFAGIKTFWPHAEKYLDEVLQDIPVLATRVGALRFLSRLASRGIGYGDTLPLSIDRLAGAKGALLREAIEELATGGSLVGARLTSFTHWYLRHSELGYALHRVTPELWDEVLAWVAASLRTDEEWYEQNLDLVDSYLLGATLFRYRSVMGDAFRRLAFSEALDAGGRGLPFPAAQIVAVARAKHELKGARGRAVRTLASAEDNMTTAAENGWLLTALAQRIPYQQSGFDWDHIFPRAEAGRMWAPGAAKRRRHHPDRRLVNTTGNFWALPASANRALGRIVGEPKFKLLREWMADSDGERVWTRDRWAMTDEEVVNFIQVDHLLNDDPESIEAAMRLFRSTVMGRTRRLFDDALARFPMVREFAADPDAPKYDASPLQPDYRAALGLKSGDPDLRLLSKGEVKSTFKKRARELRDVIEPLLHASGVYADSWLWNNSAGNRACAAFELVGGNCIELFLQWDSGRGAYFAVKAYPSRRRPNAPHLYPEFDHIVLDARWTDTDEHVAQRFMAAVERLEYTHPRSASHPVASDL